MNFKTVAKIIFFIQPTLRCIGGLQKCGVHSERIPFDGDMPDEDDRVFYEVSLSKEDSFLVTGNLKHFPKTPKVITAAQMMEILDNEF